MLTVLTGADKIASTDTFLDVCPSVVHCTLAIDNTVNWAVIYPRDRTGINKDKKISSKSLMIILWTANTFLKKKRVKNQIHNSA